MGGRKIRKHTENFKTFNEIQDDNVSDLEDEQFETLPTTDMGQRSTNTHVPDERSKTNR
jgi:hypothetical protein